MKGCGLLRPHPCILSLQGLEDTIEKMSPTLNVNATYKKISRISRLPAYLTIQYIRFFVGKAGDAQEMVAKKILKVIGILIRGIGGVG